MVGGLVIRPLKDNTIFNRMIHKIMYEIQGKILQLAEAYGKWLKHQRY